MFWVRKQRWGWGVMWRQEAPKWVSEAGSHRCQVQESQRQRCPSPHSPPEQTPPTHPELGPQPTAGGKPCLPWPCSQAHSGPAQGEGPNETRDGTAGAPERGNPASDTPPEAEVGVGSGRQTPPFGIDLEGARPQARAGVLGGRGRTGQRARGDRLSVASRVKCL